jgi:endonuclease-8
MEGPSLLIAAEQLVVFKGKPIRIVSGNSKIGIERLEGKEVFDVFSWGKHLVFQFNDFAMRIHFMLFGTYEAEINGIAVTGDYRRTKVPRLQMEFDTGIVKLFNCSVKFIESTHAKNDYDFTIDVMSPQWNTEYAITQVKNYPEEQIADVLLDQTVFSGVGNIIKNEVLSLVQVNPKTRVKDLSAQKIKKLVICAQDFSQQFYEWRKAFVLLKHLTIYRKGKCPHCSGKVTREKTGKRQRWSYYCPICQPLAQ